MKKILIVSDTHGSVDNLYKLVENIKNEIDVLIHLGDLCTDIKNLVLKYSNIEYYSVLGNCDFTNYANNEELIDINGNKIFLTHGSSFGVKGGPQRLVYAAIERGADICLFGHTHCPIIFEEQNIIFMNPGSLSLPRGCSYKTYGIINVFEDKAPEFSIVTQEEKGNKIIMYY